MLNPNSLQIRKEQNDNVLVTIANLKRFNLLSESYLTQMINSVIVRGKDGTFLYEFFYEEVLRVVRKDGTIVLISDNDTLFSELNEFFFFINNEGGGGGGGITELPVGNSVFVSTLGDDGTALRERFDLPFLTIDSAVLAANSGDTIIVYPGNYNAFQALHKEGVKWLFLGGPVLNLFSNAKWYDNNLPTEINIQGDADIVSFVSNEVLLIENDGTVATVNFRNVTGRGSNVISLTNGSGVINIQKNLNCNTVNRPLNLRGNSKFTINVDSITNTGFAGVRPCVYLRYNAGSTAHNIINVRLIENLTNDYSLCVVSEFTVQEGTTIINVSGEIKHNAISPYSFVNKTVWHMAGNLIINGNIDGGNTVALSRVYGFANFTRFEHNGKMTNDGTTPLIENNQAGDNEFIFNGVYETTNPIVFQIAGSNKNTINGEIYNRNTDPVQKRGIETNSSTKLILGLLKIVFDDISVPSFGIAGTNAANIKIIHNVSSNQDTNTNITNLITGTNYVFDTEVE